MRVDEIERIAVVGAGIMGHAIAQEYARAGFQVCLNDVSEERLQLALDNVKNNLERLVDLGLAEKEQVEPTLNRLQVTTRLEEAVSEADLVVEVIPEHLAPKQQLFQQLDKICPARTILASNTSTILPSNLAQATTRPDKVVVTHYMVPPYLLPFVEVVRGPATTDETVETICNLLVRQGKRPAVLQREIPGFIINRLQGAMLREAFSLVQHGIITPREIDSLFVSGLGPRWVATGPFELMDIQGLDTWAAAMAYLLPLLEASTEVPSQLREMVERGELGVKSGKGFGECSPEGAQALQLRIAQVLARLAQQPAV